MKKIKTFLSLALSAALLFTSAAPAMAATAVQQPQSSGSIGADPLLSLSIGETAPIGDPTEKLSTGNYLCIRANSYGSSSTSEITRSFSYNEKNLLSSKKETSSSKYGTYSTTTSFTYNVKNQMIKSVEAYSSGTKNVCLYSYDSKGNLTKAAWESYTWNYSYDSANRLKTLHVLGSGGLDANYKYTYDAKNRLIKRDYYATANSSPATTTWTYNSAGKVATCNAEDPISHDFNKTAYTYDANGCLHYEDSVPAGSRHEVVYEYAPKPTRIAGSSRYDTAVQIAKKAFSSGSEWVVIASGEKFPDALAAVGYAGVKNAPILLTRKDALPTQVKDLIKKWGNVKQAVIFGSEDSVSGAIDTTLKNECSINAAKIYRIEGKNRYETAELAEKYGSFPSDSTCVVASGISPADALSISPWCYKNKMPLFLANKDGNLTTESMDALKKYTKVYICGSTNSVSDETETSLKAAGLAVKRLSGTNRYGTSVAIAQEFAGSFNNVTFASGADASFADPLVGGVLAGKNGVPIILVSGATGYSISYTKSTIVKDTGIKTLYFLGGPTSMTNTAGNAILQSW